MERDRETSWMPWDKVCAGRSSTLATDVPASLATRPSLNARKTDRTGRCAAFWLRWRSSEISRSSNREIGDLQDFHHLRRRSLNAALRCRTAVGGLARPAPGSTLVPPSFSLLASAVPLHP